MEAEDVIELEVEKEETIESESETIPLPPDAALPGRCGGGGGASKRAWLGAWLRALLGVGAGQKVEVEDG